MIALNNIDPAHVVEGIAAVNPASIASGAIGNTDITGIPGLTTDMRVFACPQAQLGVGLVLNGAWCPADGTLRIALYNPTGGAVDLGSVNWAYFAFKPRT